MSDTPFISPGKYSTHLPDADGRTPLSHLAESGYDDTVAKLLKLDDIEVNLPDKDGRTPLW